MREIKEVLHSNGFKFNKAFGQNFISDTNLLKAIVSDAGVESGDVVLEIGVGAGALTKELAKVAKKVVAFEIDENLKNILDETLCEFDNIDLNFADIMKVDVKEIEKKCGKSYKVVANLPYYITTPIVMMFLEDMAVMPRSITVMVQKEVADRFVAKENTENYGAITVAINSIANAKITRNVNRQMFYPVPNVDSAVVRIDIDCKKYDILDMPLFKRVYKASFAMRRKTLANNLIAAFGLKRDVVEEVLALSELSVSTRGECLSVGNMVTLANILKKYIK